MGNQAAKKPVESLPELKKLVDLTLYSMIPLMILSAITGYYPTL